MKRVMNGVVESCVLLVVLCWLLFPGTASAEGVKARYIQNSSTGSVLELLIGKPAPTSIIVKQHIPPKTRIAEVSPAITKTSSATGVLTWLLKAPMPGSLRIRLQYQEPLVKGGATAVIRCKSPLDGRLMTIRVD